MKKKIVLYLFLFFLGYQKNMAQINQKDSIDLVIDLVKIDFKKYDFNHFSKEFGKKNLLNPTFVIWEKNDIVTWNEIFQSDIEVDSLENLNDSTKLIHKISKRKLYKKSNLNIVQVSYTLPYQIKDTEFFIFVKKKKFKVIRETLYVKEFCVYQRRGNEWINIISVNDFILY